MAPSGSPPSAGGHEGISGGRPVERNDYSTVLKLRPNPVPIAGAGPPEPEGRRADLPGSVVIILDNEVDSRHFNIRERGIGKWKSHGVIF